MNWDSSDAESDYQADKLLREAAETVRQRREARRRAKGPAK